MHIVFVLFSPGSVEADVGGGGNLNRHKLLSIMSGSFFERQSIL